MTSSKTNFAVMTIALAAALLFVCGCGGGTVVSNDPDPGTAYINWNVSVVGAANHQSNSHCIFAEGIANEYFAVWEDLRGGADCDIYARFFDSLRAEPVSTEIVICNVAGHQLVPKIAYNTQSEEMLVIWEDYNAGDSDIFGQLVDAATGALIGTNFAISSVIGTDERSPRATYNSTRNDYLVTWDEDNGTDLDIMGRIVSASGTIPGAAFVITPTAGDQQSAVVAYDPVADQYFVVFMDFVLNPLESDLYGQFVAYDGGLVGSDFAVNGDSGNQDFPTTIYNDMQDVFIVAWEDDQLGDRDITAQIIEPNGTLSGQPFILSPDWTEQQNCDLAYNDSWGEYLAVWEDGRLGGNDIFSQSLTSNSFFVGGNIVINDYAVTSIQPAACANGVDREFFTTWTSMASAGHNDIKGQLTYVSY